MMLSTRTRYAARAMAELGSAYPDGTVSVRSVAQSQRVSPKYLEQILHSLRAAGLVRAVRGMRGGYALARPPASITLKEVFEVFEGSAAPVHCVDQPDSCPLVDVCPTRETWAEMKEALLRVLQRTTIGHLVERKARKAGSSALTYQI